MIRILATAATTTTLVATLVGVAVFHGRALVRTFRGDL